MAERDNADLKSYKIIETRLYGELTKTCRRYSSELSIISILGILDIVKQEMIELDKTGRSFSKTQALDNDDFVDEDKSNLDAIH